jgi:RecA-family ATPase
LFPDIPEDEIPSPKQTSKNLPFSIYDLQGEPPERKWVVEGWLPTGEVSSLYGDGGVGKTLLAEQLGYCVVYGLDFFGLKTRKMHVFAALAEDDRNEVHRRIRKFERYYFFEPPGRGAEFQVYAYPSDDYAMVRFPNDGKPVFGKFYHRLRGFLTAMSNGPKLVLLDTLADVFDGNENIRSQANYFIKNVLRKLCTDVGATVLLLAHPSRAGLSSKDILSGSTAWNNAVRNRLILTKHDTLPDLRVLTRVKSNYAKSGEQLMLAWKGGVFDRIIETTAMQDIMKEHGERVFRILADASDDGQPFHSHTQGRRPLKDNLALFSDDTTPMTETLLQEIVKGLIKEGKIEKRSGNRHEGNGLFRKT